MIAQKIALFVSSVEPGKRLIEEALQKGHSVTAIIDSNEEFDLKDPNFKVVKGNMNRIEDVHKLVKDQDVIVSIHKLNEKKPLEHVEIARNIIDAAKKAGIRHIISVAQRADKDLNNGKEGASREIFDAQNNALKLLQNEKSLVWGYLHIADSDLGDEMIFTQMNNEVKIPENEYISIILDEVGKGSLEVNEYDIEGQRDD
jgi:putative NADH-flavin reductase